MSSNQKSRNNKGNNKDEKNINKRDKDMRDIKDSKNDDEDKDTKDDGNNEDIKEVIEIIAPSASAGLEIIKEKSEAPKNITRAGLKHQRKTNKIKNILINKEENLKRRQQKSLSTRIERQKPLSALDRCLNEFKDIKDGSSEINMPMMSSIESKKPAKSSGPKIKQPNLGKIKGMVDGKTPSEIRREAKTGLDALF